jgi:hypothetical protein
MGSPYDLNPTDMSYEDNINNNNIELKNIIKVILDSYSYDSCINIDILPKIEWILIQSSNPVIGYGIDGKLWSLPSYVEVDMKKNIECWISVKLHILENFPCNIVLGLGAWAILPLTLPLTGKIFFKGSLQVATVKTEPKFKKGEVVSFGNGTDKERNLLLNILLKHSNYIFEWSGCYGLFADHVAEIPTNGEITRMPLFPMNKIKRDAMQEILDEYIERGIVEPNICIERSSFAGQKATRTRRNSGVQEMACGRRLPPTEYHNP